MSIIHLETPISEDAVRALHVGDQVRLRGVMVTARNAAQKFIMDNFILPPSIPEEERPFRD